VFVRGGGVICSAGICRSRSGRRSRSRGRHWGRRQATASGDYVSDLGFLFPAKITAYDLIVTHNFAGTGTYAAWYQKVHVVAKRKFIGGIWRGPYDVVMDSGIHP